MIKQIIYDNDGVRQRTGWVQTTEEVNGEARETALGHDSITLYLPNNDVAKSMIEGYTGGESIQTAQGEKIIKNILFYEGYEMALNDELNGTDAPIYTSQANNNYYKSKIFTSNTKIDTINNCFYMFERKVA
ncbi:MAG: hypothetical protein Q7U16_14870 [Agitococcus sp.]|nr:hypothetical protein [Agitococcus sp.]